MTVIGCRSVRPGGIVTVVDVWIDRAEALIVRYLEVEVASSGPVRDQTPHGARPALAKRVLLPLLFAQDSTSYQGASVSVDAILGSQFADVPTLAKARIR